MFGFKCPKCKSENIKQIMYNDNGTKYAVLECDDCGEAGEYSYFDDPMGSAKKYDHCGVMLQHENT